MSAQDNLSPQQFFHGTPDERHWETGAPYGIHIGTEESARQALHARIGKPAEGAWDGTREYGRTLLDRDEIRHERTPDGWQRKVIQKPPEYPSGRASYSDSTPVPLDARPNIFPVAIAGGMTNTPDRPHEDFKANGMMRGNIARGRAKNGYYYKNASEDEGSISAVVPSAQHLRRLNRGGQN
jgi:hypothetical protein